MSLTLSFVRLNRRIRIANQTREEVVDFLARAEENRILTDRAKQAEREEAESADSQTSEEAKYELSKEKRKSGQDKYFARQIDKWDGEDHGGSFRVGKVSEALLEVGIPDVDIWFDQSKAAKQLSEKSEITKEVIKKIPDILENPIAISESYDNTVMVFGQVFDDNRNPIVVALRVNSTNRRNHITLVNKIRSIGTRSHNLDTLLSEDALLYLGKNKKETQNWFNALGRSTPFGGTKSGLIRSISYSAENVKASLKKDDKADASSSDAKKAAEEETAEAIEEREKRTALATMQDRARKVVAGFDTLPIEKRRAIEAMYRSAEQSGADGTAADAAAHLLAILPDTQIRFTAEIGKNGLYDRLSSGERVILLNPKTDAEGGVVQTLLHEVTHHLEGRAGYKELSKLAVELYGDKKAGEVRSRYREYAKKSGLAMSDEYVEQEVVAEAVGELLVKGKYVARMRNRSILVNAVAQMGRWAKTLVGKNKDAYAAALKLQTAFTKCLARTPAEAVEVMRGVVANEGVKYSYQNADSKVIEFANSVRSMSDKSRLSKRKFKIGDISDFHAEMISKIIKEEIGSDINLSGYEIWIDGNAIQHIDNRHGSNGDADQTMSDVRDIGMIPWVVNHSDGGYIARNEDGSLDFSEMFNNSDGTAAPIVLLHKNIGNQQFVVAECVPDSRAKRLHIVSAYKKSSSEGQVLNMESDDSPQPTSEVPHGGNATTKNSIPHSSDSVKRKYSLQSSELNNFTESQQFKRWFGDWQNDPDEASKVVNEDGTPKVVYHGTDAEFTAFSKEKLGAAHTTDEYEEVFAAVSKLGFFATDSIEYAKEYSTKKKAMELYYSIKNPYVMSYQDFYTYYEEGGEEAIQDFKDELVEEGYDGIVAYTSDGYTEYIAFEAEQIKSATDNIGTFDGTNPDIRYSLPKQSSELNKARREARTQASRAEREQARADRIKAELTLYKAHQIDSKDIIEYADRQLSTYNGKLPKDRLRELFLNLAARLEYLNEHPKGKSADQIRRDIDTDIETLAEEIAYNF